MDEVETPSQVAGVTVIITVVIICLIYVAVPKQSINEVFFH